MGRVSAPGEHGHQAGRARKPRERLICWAKGSVVGDVRKRANVNKTIENTGDSVDAGYPRCGEGCGDTLTEVRVLFRALF